MRLSADFHPVTKRRYFGRIQVLRDGRYFGTFRDADVIRDKEHGAVYALVDGGLTHQISADDMEAAIYRVIYPDATFIECQMRLLSVDGMAARSCKQLSLLYVGDDIICGEVKEAFRL